MVDEYYKEGSNWNVIIENFSVTLHLSATFVKYAMLIFSETMVILKTYKNTKKNFFATKRSCYD